MREKRTDKNFDEHELVEVLTGEVSIYKFYKPDTRHGGITFINTQGILAVTGDYGNWIFCREFHPSADGFVSDHYWCEKLRMSSTQHPSDYDAEGTRGEINERMEEEDVSDAEKVYLESLLDQVDECEERYMIYAYDNLPDGHDHEYIPLVKKLNPWLEVIFDAFDEICRRKEEVDWSRKMKGVDQ